MKRMCAIVCLACALALAADSAKSTLEAAQAALADGDYARAIEHAEQAAGVFHSRHNSTDEALACNIAGSAYLHTGEYDLALARYRTALSLDRQRHDAAGEVTRLTNIGSVYFFRGQYLEALGEYQHALQRVQEAGGDRQLVYANLATLYDQLGENDEALAYYQRALALGPNPPLLSGIGTLYLEMGNHPKAIESYRASLALHPDATTWEELGVTQANCVPQEFDTALTSFNEAVKVASAKELPLARLYRGEALYRLNRQEEAREDFRASGDNWLALYRLGDLTKALALRDLPLPSDFFPHKQTLYNTVIATTTDPVRLFTLLERAHESPIDPPQLEAVQARLASGSLLLEHWFGTTLWATSKHAGIAADPSAIPFAGVTQLLTVPPPSGPAPTGKYLDSFLPYASLLIRDEPWRTPLLPWRARELTVTNKHDLYTREAPILIFNASATTDLAHPNRSHLKISPAESLYRTEIQTLPLAKADVVILIASDPALVFSFAFLAAGARSTLTTLRPVPHAAAQQFVRHFLARLSAGETKARALRATSIAFPQYAPAFILTGDGQQPTRPVLSWWWIVTPALIAGGSIILLWRR